LALKGCLKAKKVEIAYLVPRDRFLGGDYDRALYS
jgi:hypothetical protein